MSDSPAYVPPKVWTVGCTQRRPLRQHQSPGRGSDARKGTAGRQPSAAALLARDAEWREGHGAARRAAGDRQIAAPNTTPIPINIGEGDQFGSGFVAINPNSKIPALARPQHVAADARLRIRRDPGLPRREVRCVPAEGPVAARRMPVVAVLADGQRAVPRRRLRPLLRLRARRSSSTRSTATRWK